MNIQKAQAITAIALAALALAFFIAFKIFISAPADFPPDTTFSVEPGSSLGLIARDLKDHNLIRSEFSFKVLAVLMGGDRHIVAGDYFLENPISSASIAYRLVMGRQYLKTIKVTVPEGFTVADIASAVSAGISNFNKAKFLAEAGDKEGYLFPDTYFLYPSYKPEQVIALMNDNFNMKIAPLAEEIKKSGHSLNEIVTMASLIEKESGGPADKVAISSILWKRIKLGIALQVDAAPDTYNYRGLPPAPIVNPGMDSILAALRPTATPYLYYIHDKQGNIHLARTFEEHKANRVKYLNE